MTPTFQLPTASLLVTALCLAGCKGPASAPKPDAKPPNAQRQRPVAAAEPAAERDKGPTVEDELSGYRERRKQRPAIIGGCRERCETPEAAIANFLDRLQRGDDAARALHECFEWSLLVVDGQPRGARWAEMWARPTAHATRREEIAAWLDDWSRFATTAPKAALASAAATARLLPDESPADERVFSWRPPPGPDGEAPRGESTWRMTLHKRGHEWLISEIQHAPSRPPQRAPAEVSPDASRPGVQP